MCGVENLYIQVLTFGLWFSIVLVAVTARLLPIPGRGCKVCGITRSKRPYCLERKSKVMESDLQLWLVASGGGATSLTRQTDMYVLTSIMNPAGVLSMLHCMNGEIVCV